MGLYTAAADGVATGTALKTILQLATTSTQARIRIVELGVTFDGTSSSATPVEVRLQRQTAAGTGGVALASNYGVNALDPGDAAALTTAVKGPSGTWGTEPTAGAILAAWKVPPTSGIVVQYPLGQEPVETNSKWIAIVVTAAATVNATAYVKWQE